MSQGDASVRSDVIDETDEWMSELRDAELAETQRRSRRHDSAGQLAGGVEHDLNNVLAAILGYAEILSEEVSDDRHRKYAGEIERAALRGAALVRPLLTFAQCDHVEPQPVDLDEVLAAMEPLLRATLGDSIQLQITPAETPCTLVADPAHLEQVILNLCVNARDAMPDGGILWIATSVVLDAADATAWHGNGAVATGRIVLTVTDTGTGIAAEIRERIFEPFVTTKDVTKGTGLGLATVLGIVESAGGTIDVASRPGQGTTFEVTLPMGAPGR